MNNKEITLDTGKTETVSFTLKNLLPGKYSVAINEKISQFTMELPAKTVTEPPPKPEPATTRVTTLISTPAPLPQEKSTAPLAWIILGAIIVLALITGIIIIRRREKHS